MRGDSFAMLAALPLAMGLTPSVGGAARAPALRRLQVAMLESGAQTGGGAGRRHAAIGLADLPSLMLNNRIVYLGMPIAAQVSELLVSELLFLR